MKSKNMKRVIALILFVLFTFVNVCNTSIIANAAKKKTIKVTKLRVTNVSKSSLTMARGQNYTLKVNVLPTNATNKKLIFKSSNKKIATISSKGKITAKKTGTAKITVKAADKSKKTLTIKLKVVTRVKVSSIHLDKASLNLEIGKSYALKTTLTPATASNKKISYTSSNSAVASVSSTGTIKGISTGKATITAKAADGSGKYAKCTVTVTAPFVKVTSVRLNQTKLSLNRNESYNLLASITPANANNQSVSFSSSNEKVASVTSTGKVTGLSAGSAVITAKANDGSKKSASCTVKVSEYALIFEDNFDGNQLNDQIWTCEEQKPGYENNELQAYTKDSSNVYLADGNLVIKANKDGDNYTSGKVTTKNKVKFRYGRFEIRAKAVNGRGLWPAISLRANNEKLYGAWPRCGEIDIMEVLGHESKKSYSSIHYGNPHKEQQESYSLEQGSLADDYHVYAVDWNPDKISFYVDDHLVNEATDWYSATDGIGEATFPAPFDQYFYLRLNLAVGGNWPGNPDSTTNFDNARFMIDYVKVYKKQNYNENVSKPEKEAVPLRDPDSEGNYIVNGDFSDTTDNLNDDIAWGQKKAGGGVFEASIENKQLVVRTENEGSLTYSVQIVQPDLPMKKGSTYKLTFDAYAYAERSMYVDVMGPDHSYIRYMPDTLVNLETSKKSYEYTFTMSEEDDANGCLEFALGGQNSVATVYISNVKLVKVSDGSIEEAEKTMLSDGNYVYNGKFQEGTNRLGYWTIDKIDGAEVVVTNDGEFERELKASSPNNSSSYDDIQVKQKVSIQSGKTYLLTFDAYSSVDKDIQVKLNGQSSLIHLSSDKKACEITIKSGESITDQELIFALGCPGVTYIDNIRLVENALLNNGDFTNSFTGWSPFVDGGIASSVNYTASNKEAVFTIDDTGDEDWKIQLMQDDINLEQGKTYKLSFKAKTDLSGGRHIMVSLQHNGSEDNNWTSYSGMQKFSLSENYTEYSLTFEMTTETDPLARLSFSMGAIGGKEITNHHQVSIDDVVLEEQ